jgi:hypothetical protein
MENLPCVGDPVIELFSFSLVMGLAALDLYGKYSVSKDEPA